MSTLTPAYNFTDDDRNEALIWSDKDGKIIASLPEELRMSVNDALQLAEAIKKVALNAQQAKRKLTVRHED